MLKLKLVGGKSRRRFERAPKRGVPMPDGFRELVTTGRLQPEPNGMKCSMCGEPVSLLLNQPPVKVGPDKVPAGVWGKDVLVICRCCSFSGCTHREVKAPA